MCGQCCVVYAHTALLELHDFHTKLHGKLRITEKVQKKNMHMDLLKCNTSRRRANRLQTWCYTTLGKLPAILRWQFPIDWTVCETKAVAHNKLLWKQCTQSTDCL